jgi:hypothetical protein
VERVAYDFDDCAHDKKEREGTSHDKPKKVRDKTVKERKEEEKSTRFRT